jgi:Ni,Fe-hydrogenase maturation factor
LVAETVAAWQLPEVLALAVPQLTPELAELLAEAQSAVFVDACVTTEAGVEVQPLDASRWQESLGHTSDPGTLLALAAAVYGRSPPAWLVRIPIESFGFGIGLSRQATIGVSAALREVARLLAPT